VSYNTPYVGHDDARRRVASGETVPALGMGTWHLGQGRHPEAVEIEALQTGLGA
jgi:diketogulonate reductase-like aldo/keto reductase